MNKLKFLYDIFTYRTIHFLRVYWGFPEWRIVFQTFLGMNNPKSKETIQKFESAIRALTGAKYCLATNYGRSAIQIVLEAYAFPPESEVIVPSFMCGVVCAAIIQSGCAPVFVDVNRDLNISAESVSKAVGKHTKAILISHLSGEWAEDTYEIIEMARSKGVKIIEDACQAFSLQVGNKWAGTFGDVGVFSFGPGKIPFGPGGGALITNDEKVIEHCQSRLLEEEGDGSARSRVGSFAWKYGLLRYHYPFVFTYDYLKGLIASKGQQKNFLDSHIIPWFNIFRISPIEASLALCQVGKYKEIVERRQRNAKAILSSGCFLTDRWQLPSAENNVFNKFLVSYLGHPQEEKKNLIQRILHYEGVETEGSYTPLHLRPPFRKYRRVPLPNTEKLWQGAFCLPVNPHIGEKEISRVISALRKASLF